MSFAGWNHYVDSFQVLKKTDKNKFEAFIRLKKHNVMTNPRQAYLNISYVGNCIGEEGSNSEDMFQLGSKSYAYIKTQKHDSCSKESVMMYLDQQIELSQVNSNSILMTIMHRLDYKAYNVVVSNLNVSLSFFEDIEFFPNYCLQYKLRYKRARFIEKQQAIS